MQNLIKIGSAVWAVALTQTHAHTHAHTHTRTHAHTLSLAWHPHVGKSAHGRPQGPETIGMKGKSAPTNNSPQHDQQTTIKDKNKTKEQKANRQRNQGESEPHQKAKERKSKGSFGGRLVGQK